MDNDIKLIEEKWIQWDGPIQLLRLDASRAHTSEKYSTWADERGIELRMITRAGHHELGILDETVKFDQNTCPSTTRHTRTTT